MELRYKDTKYGFATMQVGDEKRIRCRANDRDRTLAKIRSACSAEKAKKRGEYVCRADASGVYYKLVSIPEPEEEIINK